MKHTLAIGVLMVLLSMSATTPRQAGARDVARPPDRPLVYVWYPARFGTWHTESIRWDLITHISYRSVVIQADGSLHEPLGRGNDQNLRRFIEKARQNGVKVTVLVWVNNRQDSDSYLAHHREKVAQNLLEYVQRFDLDGINMDDEMMREFNEAAGQPNRELVTDFFRILHRTFKEANPDYHISYAAPPVISTEDRFGQSWLDIGAITEVVDAIIPMGYEMNPPTIGWASAREPLAGGGKAPTTTTRDISTMVADYLQAMGGQRRKLLAGVSVDFGGREWKTPTDHRLSATIGPATNRTLAEAEAAAEQHGRRWDDLQQSPWYVYRDESGQFVQGWYSDARSWRIRLQWIHQQGLGGIGIWVIDGRNDPAERWQLLEEYMNMHGNAEAQ